MIRWDAPLARALADELNLTMAGWRARSLRLDGASADVVLRFREGTLRWRLRPGGAAPRLAPADSQSGNDLSFPMRLRSVTSPPDERLVVMSFLPLRRTGKPHDVIVELVGTRLNCLVVESPSSVVRHALHTPPGPRRLTPGSRYQTPKPSVREGVHGLTQDRFAEILGSGSVRSLPARLAWTSPINARALRRCLSRQGPKEAYDLWSRLAGPRVGERTGQPGRATSGPVLLEGEQPYPYTLPGVASRPTPSLVAAFMELVEPRGNDGASSGRGAAIDQGPGSAFEPAPLRRLGAAYGRLRRRLRRLEGQLSQNPDPDELRSLGDLLLARYREIPHGAAQAELDDMYGRRVVVSLRPGAPAHVSAEQYYKRAKKAERTAARLPRLIAGAKERLQHLRRLERDLREGVADEDELARILPAPGPDAEDGARGASVGFLPYRSYRSSQGSEIRVGRGAKQNDELTFRHSAPEDIWLHARHAAGAHVILRRIRRNDNPSATELNEAAVLAALYSKARGAGLVPVDWTRRRYVRKPRGSPPGVVAPDRVKTVFAKPDADLARTLEEAAS